MSKKQQKTGMKDTNPKDYIGSNKLPISLVPKQVIGHIALAMLEGSLKYGAYNYRDAGVRASIYEDAKCRHGDRWWEGEDIDPDSGQHHIFKEIASLIVLADGILNDNWVDDRPPKVKNTKWVEELNKEAEKLIDKYPNPVKPYTAKNKHEKRT